MRNEKRADLNSSNVDVFNSIKFIHEQEQSLVYCRSHAAERAAIERAAEGRAPLAARADSIEILDRKATATYFHRSSISRARIKLAPTSARLTL